MPDPGLFPYPALDFEFFCINLSFLILQRHEDNGMLQAGLWVRLHFFHFADLDLAVFLNADKDTPLKKLCKKLP